jgi:hypothetical protein
MCSKVLDLHRLLHTLQTSNCTDFTMDSDKAGALSTIVIDCPVLIYSITPVYMAKTRVQVIQLTSLVILNQNICWTYCRLILKTALGWSAHSERKIARRGEGIDSRLRRYRDYIWQGLINAAGTKSSVNMGVWALKP